MVSQLVLKAYYLSPAQAQDVHDVALTEISTSPNLFADQQVFINVTVENQGIYSETVNVSLYYTRLYDRLIGTQNVTLATGANTTLTFEWTPNMTGRYEIRAEASEVPGEVDTADNSLVGGTVFVTITGDVDGDGKVDASDLFDLSKAYGSDPSKPNWNPNCDFNDDGKVDASDLFNLSKNYGKTI